MKLSGILREPLVHFLLLGRVAPESADSRTIEVNAVPRWTAYAAKRFGIKMPPEVQMKHQERTWSSPIWYTPS